MTLPEAPETTKSKRPHHPLNDKVVELKPGQYTIGSGTRVTNGHPGRVWAVKDGKVMIHFGDRFGTMVANVDDLIET